MQLDERQLGWVYPFTAALGLFLALFLPSATRRIAPPKRTAYLYLQAITLAGAVVGAKLAMLAGDLGWPNNAVSLDQLLFSGKSLVGGLLGGLISAELAKPLFDYREPPNDWFATKLVLSIAIGRIGCICAGCCRGLPTTSAFALTYSDGIPRFPAAPLELLFHAGLFVVFLILFRRRRFEGRLFAAYAILYGAFRIATEPFRETPKGPSGASVYQLLALALLIAGAVSLLRRIPEPNLVKGTA